jgi:hypothetical protein
MTRIPARLALALLLATAAAATAQDVDRPGHREFAWDGGDTLSVGGAMTVRVRQDGPARVVVTGPDDLVREVTLNNGRLGFDNGWRWFGRSFSGKGDIQVTITGVKLNDVSVSGSSVVTLGVLRQPELTVDVSGSGEIRAEGRVERLQARVSGSGGARLGGLSAREGELHVSGSGDIAVAALEDVHARVSGSGQIHIKDAPRAIDHRISGSGRLVAGGQTYRRR